MRCQNERTATSLCMLYSSEHGAGREVHPSKDHQTSYDGGKRDLSSNSEMQKSVGMRMGIGITLSRTPYLITVSVIALTRVEGGWVVKLEVMFD